MSLRVRRRSTLSAVLVCLALALSTLMSAAGAGAAVPYNSFGLVSWSFPSCMVPQSTANGAPNLLKPCGGWSAQPRWLIDATINHGFNTATDVYAHIKDIQSGKCLDTAYGGVSDGTPAVIGTCNSSSPTQVWHITGFTRADSHAPTHLRVSNFRSEQYHRPMCLTAFANEQTLNGETGNYEYVFPCMTDWAKTNQEWIDQTSGRTA